MAIRKNNHFTLNSFVDEVEKELNQEKKKALKKAEKELKRRVRAKIKALGLVDEGDLLKGVSSTSFENASLVGMAAPAFHALLVELGHLVVLPKGKSPKNPNAKVVVEGKPYFMPAFRESQEKLIDILSDWG